MKLLLDENLSHRHAAVLREQGHDAVAVVEVGLSGQPDSIVRMFAIESGRILLTLDADFGNFLRFPPAGTPGVIRLKIHPPIEDGIREQIEKTLHTLRDASLVGCLAVSHGGIVRNRWQDIHLKRMVISCLRPRVPRSSFILRKDDGSRPCATQVQ